MEGWGERVLHDDEQFERHDEHQHQHGHGHGVGCE